MNSKSKCATCRNAINNSGGVFCMYYGKEVEQPVTSCDFAMTDKYANNLKNIYVAELPPIVTEEESSDKLGAIILIVFLIALVS